MKKRLLITSIVMMLVVAVALSTATYAWFTSNQKVTADAVVLQAATMNEDAILISHDADNTNLSQSVTLTAITVGNKLYPATPLAATGFDSAVSDSTFKNLLVDGSNTAKNKVKAAGDVSYYSDTFYIYNKGFTAVTLTPTVTIKYGTTANAFDAARSVRIAIIEKKGSAVSTGDVDLGSASLKNIFEFNAATVDTIASTNPASFDASKVYANDQKAIQTITAENFEANQSSIYEVTGYTATTTAQLNGYGVVADGDAFTQGSVNFTAVNFQTIDAPASGTYVANEYTVVIWLEGWDPQCTNAMSAGEISVDLSFQKA